MCPRPQILFGYNNMSDIHDKKNEPQKISSNSPSLDEAMAELQSLEKENQNEMSMKPKEVSYHETISVFGFIGRHKLALLLVFCLIAGAAHYLKKQDFNWNESNPISNHFKLKKTWSKNKKSGFSQSPQNKRAPTQAPPVNAPRSQAAPLRTDYFVYVKTKPEGAQVYVDNRLVTKSTPGYTFFKRNRATTIIVKKTGFATQRVLATPGTQVDVKLKPK